MATIRSKSPRCCKAARASTKGQVIAIVQPHRFTRLAIAVRWFATCFNDADTVIVADVYPAGEAPIAGVDRDALVDRDRGARPPPGAGAATPENWRAIVRDIARPGDYVICLGAGSITQWAYALPGQLATREGLSVLDARPDREGSDRASCPSCAAASPPTRRLRR